MESPISEKQLTIEHFPLDADTSINFVNTRVAAAQLLASGYRGALAPALEAGGPTDLLPGTYEGGMKVWECSEDLTRSSPVVLLPI